MSDVHLTTRVMLVPLLVVYTCMTKHFLSEWILKEEFHLAPDASYCLQFNILMYTYKTVPGLRIQDIMLNVYHLIRTLKSMVSVTLVIPWNALPAHIHELQTLNTLKKLTTECTFFLRPFWCLILSNQFLCCIYVLLHYTTLCYKLILYYYINIYISCVFTPLFWFSIIII